MSNVIFNSYLEFENTVKSFLLDKEYVPLVITFSKPILIEDISKKPISELKIACAYKILSSRETKVMFKHKPGINYSFYLNVIPYKFCNDVRLHENFILGSSIPEVGLYKNTFDFEMKIKNILTDNVRTNIVIEFSKAVFLHAYNIEPSNTFKVTASILNLSPHGVNPPIYKRRAVFYTTSSGRRFYYADYFPFQYITNITLEKDFHPPIITKSRGGKSIKLKQQYDEQFPSDQISLYEIISQSHRKAKLRDDSHCVICGNEINKETTDFVRLLINGNLCNNYKLDKLHFDYLPIGSECKKKVPESFFFSNKTIRDYCEQLREQKKV